MKYYQYIILVLASILFTNNTSAEIFLDRTLIDFGTVDRGNILNNTFKLVNNGDKEISIELINFTIPELIVETSKSILPHSSEDVLVKLDTSSLKGDLKGEVIVHTDDQDNPTLKLAITGMVKSKFVIEPREAIFLSAFKWEADKKEANLSIKNIEDKAFKIKDVKTESDAFVPGFTKLGDNSYEIHAKLNPESTPGMSQDSISIYTENEIIKLPVYTFLKQRVYVNPPGINFGQIDKKEIISNKKLEAFLNQSVFVYKLDSEDFKIEMDAVPSYLKTSKTPAEGSGSVINIPKQGKTAVFEIIVSPIIGKLKKGKFRDNIKVKTNDKNFPALEIPVFGEVL